MDKIKKFLKSLYLGDRFCERMEILENKIIIQINCISRIKNGSNNWDYYSEKDIEHGCFVFDEVVEYYSNTELEFNDEIYDIDIVDEENGVFSFVVYGCNVSEQNISTAINYQIKSRKFYVLDPSNNTIIAE